ncbi:LPXTG-motif cell wall-anchored protein [Catenulispora sp. GAS73]|uniref:LPXTG cell wall anchor domain-containing protein n=1 Tax=Catenulispora sp. GAS73 TaxID=3156269 RepID=UPI003515BE79
MKGHRDAAVPPVMVIIGVALAGTAAALWRRKRERPFEFQFAPFHITEDLDKK